jgi:hypothetical protein
MDVDDSAPRDPAFPLPHILQPGEVVERQAHADGFVIAVTSRRVIVTDSSRPVMDVPFDEVRRIQFDIERGRDATLVMVPEHIKNEPRVFSVPLANLAESALTLALIGQRINRSDKEQTG